MKRFIVLWVLVLTISIYTTAQADSTDSTEQEVVALASADSRPAVEDELSTVQVLTCFMEREAEVVPGIVPSHCIKNNLENRCSLEVSKDWLSLQSTTNLLNEYAIISNTRDRRFLPKWLLRSPKGQQTCELTLVSSPY